MCGDGSGMKLNFFSFINLAHGWGFEKYIMSLATEMARRGHETSIVTVNRKLDYVVTSLLRLYYLNRFSLSDVIRLSKAEIDRSLKGVYLHEASSLREMKRHISAADVIYSKNEILDLSILYVLNNGKVLPPIICGVHSPILCSVANSFYSRLHNYLYSSKLYGVLLNSCSAIHVPNLTEAKVIGEVFPEIRVKIYYVPHFLEVTHEKAVKWTPTFNVLFIGRLSEQKGTTTFLKIIDKLSVDPRFPNMKFTIVGTGELDLKLKVVKLCSKHTNIRYKEYVEEQLISNLYMSHDICVVPSRWETVSYVCMEAQNYGLPVVASNIAGPKDIVVDHETGVLVEPEDVEGFAKAILDFYSLKISDLRDFKAVKEKARKNISSRFSKSEVIPRLEKMFIDVCRERPYVN